MKRSEVRGRERVGLVLGSVCGCLILAGCGVGELMTPDDVFESPSQYRYQTTDLPLSHLDQRMKEIDQNFEETRTPAKVAFSYETAVHSISQRNNYAALWRGVRACAWLAKNHPEPSERQKFTSLGISMGHEALLRNSDKVESYYYLALCQIAALELRSGLPKRQALEIERNLKMALALDESFDYCGPHRHLGLLMVEADPYPLLGIDGIHTGLMHLERAVEICGDYGENHLAYAQALRYAKKFDLARAQLEQVMESKVPADRSAEHSGWLEEANELQIDLQGK